MHNCRRPQTLVHKLAFAFWKQSMKVSRFYGGFPSCRILIIRAPVRHGPSKAPAQVRSQCRRPRCNRRLMAGRGTIPASLDNLGFRGRSKGPSCDMIVSSSSINQSQAWSVDIPLYRGESVGPTARIASVLDVIEHLWMCIQHRIDEPDGTFPSRQTFFVDAIDNGCKDRGTCCPRLSLIADLVSALWRWEVPYWRLYHLPNQLLHPHIRRYCRH